MHTPGPWTALKCEYGWHIGPQPDGVCSISANRGNGYRLGDEDIQEANARLIAAAPALLEALVKMTKLASLVTVGMVVAAGDEYIEAAGLNLWCLNEGASPGDRVSTEIAESIIRDFQAHSKESQ